MVLIPTVAFMLLNVLLCKPSQRQIVQVRRWPKLFRFLRNLLISVVIAFIITIVIASSVYFLHNHRHGKLEFWIPAIIFVVVILLGLCSLTYTIPSVRYRTRSAESSISRTFLYDVAVEIIGEDRAQQNLSRLNKLYISPVLAINLIFCTISFSLALQLIPNSMEKWTYFLCLFILVFIVFIVSFMRDIHAKVRFLAFIFTITALLLLYQKYFSRNKELNDCIECAGIVFPLWILLLQLTQRRYQHYRTR